LSYGLVVVFEDRDFTLERLADDVIGLADALGISQFSFVTPWAAASACSSLSSTHNESSGA
jgi:hypothetical protein